MRVLRGVAALWLAAFCAAAIAQTQVLPDFTRLVEEQGNAVVNISTTQAVRRSALPQVPGIEDEEIQEFFRRFIPRQPGPGQGPGQALGQVVGEGFGKGHGGPDRKITSTNGRQISFPVVVADLLIFSAEWLGHFQK